ncbi:MAG: tail fiber domain-containing protein [Sediminibacterium sp.]|nr:tail fiber domain-containing protein [Sediminibacterium sp.]
MKLVNLIVVLVLLAHTKLEAQQLNYQGIARNANGVALSLQQINLRLSIRDGSTTGAIVYSETRLLRTNQFGLFTVVIGSTGASNVSGSFNTINWITGNKFLQVEIDPDGGNNFLNAGTSQLQSVPFAFFAAAAYPVGNAGGDLLGSTYPNPVIAPLAVSTNKIANNAITNEKIKDSTITNNKLANSIITINDQPLQLGGAHYFTVGTAGTNFTIRSQDSVHTFNIPTASTTARGLLSPANFTIFSNKQDALNGLGFVKSNNGLISYDNTNYTPTSRTINGFDLSANRILTTDNINEGNSNQYFTNTRARTALTGGNAINYNNSTGIISSNFSITGQPYLSYAATTGQLTANAIDLSGTQVTGTLAAARFGALTGDITNTPGSYTTIINTGAVTTAKIADNAITNAKLQNSSFTLGSTSISLGTNPTTIAGLTSITATSFIGTLTGNASTASTATTLQNARNFSITGDITAAAQSFNGATNVVLSSTLANTSVTPATYGTATSVPTITVDSKGRITNAGATTITGVSTLGSSLNSANIIIGNASNQATAVAMSGDVSISNTGATTIASSAITGTKIANGAVLLTKLENIATGTFLANISGSSAPPTAVPIPSGILNQNTIQSGASFNISGNGTIGTNLTVGGTATISSLTAAAVTSTAGGLLTGSDKRLKNRISDIELGLKEIMELRPKKYFYNVDSSNIRYGLIAQEVQSIIPDIVKPLSKEKDLLGIYMDGINVILIKAIQEQQKLIQELEKRIDQLEKKSKK